MIQPIVHQHMTAILMRHFGKTPEQAAKLATDLYTTFQSYGLDIIRGEWEKQPDPAPTWESVTYKAEKEAKKWTGSITPVVTWETLAARADELEKDGRKPWNPPELR